MAKKLHSLSLSIILTGPIMMFFLVPLEAANPAAVAEKIANLEKRIGQMEANQNEILITHQKMRTKIEELRILAGRKPKFVNS